MDCKANKELHEHFKKYIKQSIQSYEGKDLNEIELKLIKGLMIRKMEDKDKNKDKIMQTLKQYLLKKVLDMKSSQIQTAKKIKLFGTP